MTESLPEHIRMWVDRMDSMEFIEDQKFGHFEKLQPSYVQLAHQLGGFEHACLYL